MIIPLIIYGSRGRVGSQLVRYIHALTDAPVRIVGMIESDRHYLSSDGIYDENFTYQLGVPTLHDIQEVCHGRPALIVDATAAKDSMRELHRKIISETPHTIIPANKNPISLYGHDIF